MAFTEYLVYSKQYRPSQPTYLTEATVPWLLNELHSHKIAITVQSDFGQHFQECIVVPTFWRVLIKSKHLQCINGRYVQVDLVQEELLKDSLKDKAVNVKF